MMNIKFIVRNALIVALFSFTAGLAACSKGSVVSDSASQPQAQQPATQQQPAAQQQSPAQPAEQTAAQQPSPSPTLHPIMKQAQAKPGVPISVPDSVKRPLNAEEMKKAMEAMPPEVRARLQGMAQAPQGAKPQATPKK